MIVAPAVVVVTYSWRDASGSRGRCTARRAPVGVVADSAAANGLAAALSASSDCALRSYTLTYDYREQTPRASGVEVVNNLVILTFKCDDGALYVMEVPGVASELAIQADGSGVLTVNIPALQSFAALIVGGGFVGETGRPITSLLSASLEFQP